jgi:hypothetical protein
MVRSHKYRSVMWPVSSVLALHTAWNWIDDHIVCIVIGHKVCENCDSPDGAITGVPLHHHR